jgi:ubiquinone biosynthesis monooxygenase Coq7
MTARDFNLLDRLLIDAQNALGTVFGNPRAERANPGAEQPEIVLDEDDRRHAAGLMRVNHVGEVCAQALYVGQAAVARDESTRTQLLAAAQEETDHLAWCADRLRELDSRPSLLNPLWYAGSYVIGALAGLRGDGLRGRDRATGRGPSRRTLADAARSRRPQPSDPDGDEGR